MRDRRTLRRLSSCTLVLVATALSGCASAGGGRAPADAQPEVIDAHVRTDFGHTLSDRWKVMDSKEELAAEMKLNHVVGAVSMDRANVDLSDLNVINCAGPGATVDAAALEAGLASGKYRCIEIRPGDARRYAYDPEYEPTYRLAERYHVPVVLLTGASEFAFSDPRTMEGAVRRHPKVTFVLAHEGNPLDADQRDREAWLGEHRQVAVVSQTMEDPWIGAAAAVAYANSNVVLDGSALLAGNLRNASHKQIKAYVEMPVRWILMYVADPRKLMFGSGWPFTDVDIYLEAFKAAIPSSYWRAVLHDNAARVYGFAETKTKN